MFLVVVLEGICRDFLGYFLIFGKITRSYCCGIPRKGCCSASHNLNLPAAVVEDCKRPMEASLTAVVKFRGLRT